ncbi:MAG: hypothetical protein JKX76_15165 [Colwellia sp.]|nr:hypothetical protein [Colwellia sp.]
MQTTKNDNIYLWLAFLASACLCYLRAPDLFYDPRIWAEGGSVYLPQALEEGFLRNLFSTKLGYYSLLNNMSYSVITLFDLKYAAFLSVAFSFLAIMTTVSLALWLPMREIETTQQKMLLAISIVIFSNAEIWLNVINVQFYLALCAFFVLMNNPTKTNTQLKWASRLILVLALLTGPVSCFLCPIFVYRAYIERDKESYLLCAITITLTLCQALIIVGQLNESIGSRDVVFRGDFLSRWLKYNVLVPFTGDLKHSAKLLYNILGYGTFLYLAYAFIKSRKNSGTLIILGSFLFLSILSHLFSLKMQGAQRYGYAPSLILIFFLLRQLPESRKWPQLILTASLITNTLYFPMYMHESIYSTHWVKWDSALQAFRNNETNNITLWPKEWAVPTESHQYFTPAQKAPE